nr:transposase [Prevotella sp. OH937_COT-195]
MWESEIMTIMICCNFGTYRAFKDYYMYYIKGYLKHDFSTAVFCNRFVELMPRLFFKMMMFMKLYAFGKCTGITFVAGNMIPVCHNIRRYLNKLYKARTVRYVIHQGIHIVHWIKENMKNKIMPMWDEIMLRKRYITE